jgi:hypothetical protein
MNETSESRRHIHEMREKALELTADAQRTGDADVRERIQQEVRKLEFNCEQESMMAAGDIYPVE